jgi:hypothetical protein
VVAAWSLLRLFVLFFSVLSLVSLFRPLALHQWVDDKHIDVLVLLVVLRLLLLVLLLVLLVTLSLMAETIGTNRSKVYLLVWCLQLICHTCCPSITCLCVYAPL